VSTVLFVAGFALGAITIGNSTLNGGGVFQSGSQPAWWQQTSTGLSTVPAPVPGAASTTVATPTVLPATTANFGMNAGTTNHNAVVWTFTEATTAPANTELELSLTVKVGATTSTFTIYIETQTIAPTSATTYSFYFDAGTGVVNLNYWSQIGQVCPSVGACP
jgi:hypothetical protein